MTVTWTQVRRRRLAHHWLLERGGVADLASVARDVCGVHAQVVPAAEISFGMRADVTRTQIRDALCRKRSLVRTYGVRGTIHVFPADEVRLWMGARRARSKLDQKWWARRLSSFDLTPSKIDQLVAAMEAALEGRALTMKELGHEVVRRVGAWAGEGKNDYWGSTGWPNWRIALSSAAENEVLCFGPPKGPQVTFVRLDEWVGAGKRWDEAEALRTVFLRFVHAYGPVSVSAFNQWFYLPQRTAREFAAAMRKDLAEIVIDGAGPLFSTDADFADAQKGEPSVRLLPHFDCYLRGFFPRDQLAPDHVRRAAGGTGQFPVLLIDGQIAGVWERITRRRRIVVRVDSFGPLRKRQIRELEVEAQRIGHVLETEAELELGPVEVRAHL